MSYNPSNPNGQATSANSAPVVVASDQPSLTVDTENNVIKDDFSGSAINSAIWTTTKNSGGSMTTAVSGSILTIGAGTVANDWIALTSVQTFTLPFRVQVILSVSQRIVNNNFYIEIVNASGTQTTALGTIGVTSGTTQVAYRITGTTATQSDIVAQNQGVSATADTAVTASTTASYATFEIDANMDNVDYQTRTVDGASAAALDANQRNRTILDPGEQYYVQIRAINGGTNPASNTNLNVEAVMIQDTTDTPVQISKGRGNASLASSVPVDVLASSAIALTRSATATGSPTIDMNFGTLVTHESSAGSHNLLGFYFTSFDTSEVVYLQFFNATSATGTPIYSFPVGPAASATQPTILTLGAEFFGIPGKNFATALTWGISTAFATYSAASTAANYGIAVNYI